LGHTPRREKGIEVISFAAAPLFFPSMGVYYRCAVVALVNDRTGTVPLSGVKTGWTWVRSKTD
jgi:hypothetical protein